MKLMLIGGGGREHAIIRALRKNPDVELIYALPGNGGMADEAECIAISATDLPAIRAFAATHDIDYAVVAPDDPLVAGCVDMLNDMGIPCFGPRKNAAIIEGSKAFAKELMHKYGIPTAEYAIFTEMDKALAYARHFPAIDWLQSYSLYQDRLAPWFNSNVNPDWSALVAETMHLLQVESELDEIVRLVGIDALSFKDRLTLETARSIREDYLHQNAFHEVDTYTSPKKQYMMLDVILQCYRKSLEALDHDASFAKLMAMPVQERIGRLKYVPEDRVEAEYRDILKSITEQTAALTEGGAF